jgi:hypothetical protein
MPMPQKKFGVTCYYNYGDERSLKFCVAVLSSLQLAKNFRHWLLRNYRDWFDIEEITTLADDEGNVFILEEGTANSFEQEDALFRLKMLAFVVSKGACGNSIEYFFRSGNLREAWDTCKNAGWIMTILEQSGLEQELRDAFYYIDPTDGVEEGLWSDLNDAAWVKYVREFIAYDDVVFAINAKIATKSR